MKTSRDSRTSRLARIASSGVLADRREHKCCVCAGSPLAVGILTFDRPVILSAFPELRARRRFPLCKQCRKKITWIEDHSGMSETGHMWAMVPKDAAMAGKDASKRNQPDQGNSGMSEDLKP